MCLRWIRGWVLLTIRILGRRSPVLIVVVLPTIIGIRILTCLLRPIVLRLHLSVRSRCRRRLLAMLCLLCRRSCLLILRIPLKRGQQVIDGAVHFFSEVKSIRENHKKLPPWGCFRNIPQVESPSTRIIRCQAVSRHLRCRKPLLTQRLLHLLPAGSHVATPFSTPFPMPLHRPQRRPHRINKPRHQLIKIIKRKDVSRDGLNLERRCQLQGGRMWPSFLYLDVPNEFPRQAHRNVQCLERPFVRSDDGRANSSVSDLFGSVVH